MKQSRTATFLAVSLALLATSCAHNEERPSAPVAPPPMPAQPPAAKAAPEAVALEKAPPSVSAEPPEAVPAARKLPAGDSLEGSRHVRLGVPTDADPNDDYLINREQWVASYNKDRLVPNWVAWELIGDDLGSLKRPKPEPFAEDAGLPEKMPRIDHKSYKGTGYDRGHMCPSADRNTTQEVNKLTYLMTNMQPQWHDLNGFPWKGLEDYERCLALNGKQLAIVAGGVFTTSSEKIGKVGISVPSANFKIVVVMEKGGDVSRISEATPVYAVLMPNIEGIAKTKWTKYLVSVDKVEDATGYDFLTSVPESIQKVLEAKVAPVPPACVVPKK